MVTTFVSAAAAMILLSFPSQAADIPRCGLGASLKCPRGAALLFHLNARHRRWLEADAMPEICTTPSPGIGGRRVGPGIVIADSRGRVGSLILDNDQLDNIAAGLGVRATGDAQAEGAAASTSVGVSTVVGQPEPQNALSTGQVMATAVGTTTTGPAVASSTLILTATVR